MWCDLVKVGVDDKGRGMYRCRHGRCRRVIRTSIEDVQVDLECLASENRTGVVYIRRPHPLTFSGVRMAIQTARRMCKTYQAARARWKDAGRPLTNEAERAERLKACDSCPARRPMLGGDMCDRCGCFVSEPKSLGPIVRVMRWLGWQTKPEWSTEHCPMAKWPGETPASAPCGCGKKARKQIVAEPSGPDVQALEGVS